MLEVAVRVQNWATKYVEERTKAASRAHSSSLGAAGYALKSQITAGMRQQAPGGLPWPRASSWVQFGASLAGRARMSRRRLERRKRAPKTPPPALYGTSGRTPLKKLASGARYIKSSSGEETRVRIGFLTDRLAQLAAYHAVAHTVPVTAKMRRLIFAVGLGIRKSSLTIPARPHVEPVYRKNEARLQGFVKQRVNLAWGGQDPKSVQF
jgi:hypothetical protein